MVTSVNGNPHATAVTHGHSSAGSSTLQAGATTAASHSAAEQAVVYTGETDAQSQSAVLAVQDSLNTAASLTDLGLGATSTIVVLLAAAREKAAAARSADPQTRAHLDADYQDVLQKIDHTAKSASFRDTNLVEGGASENLHVKVDVRGDAVISLKIRDFTTGGPTLKLAGSNLLGSPEELQSLLDRIDAARSELNGHVQEIGAQSIQIQAHLRIVARLQSALSDPASEDQDAESARLQALQVQQALAAQAVAVANQGPHALLALLRD